MVNKMVIKVKPEGEKKVELCQIEFTIKNRRLVTREVEITIK